MSWLDDVLAQLQGGAAPAAYTPASAGFPDAPPKPPGPDYEAEAALAQEARDAAGARMARANQRRIDPFGMPDMNAAGVQLAMGHAPPGTGVPVPEGAQFAPMSIPPSMMAAKAMTAPPAPPPQPAGPVPPMGEPAGEAAAPLASMGPPTDVGAVRRTAGPAGPVAPVPMGPMPTPEQKPLAERLADLGPGLVAIGAQLTGEGSGPAERMALNRQKLAEQATTQNLTARALLARGAPPQEVAAAIRSPELLKGLVSKYFETKAAQNVGGKLVREKPDGSVEVIADFGDEKAPTQREIKLPDGSVQQQEWNKGKSAWENVGKPAPGERDKRMSITDITKLSEEGAKADQVRGFSRSFQPGYAGWKVNSVGEIANTLGRNLPESVVGEERAKASQWWQDYDAYKNQVRHGLYGASLTKNEQGAFLKADIHPGMDPAQIQRNLERQQRLVENSIRRKGKALIGSTYDRDAVAKAFGVAPDFFDQADEPAEAPAARRSGTVDIGGKKIPWSIN